MRGRRGNGWVGRQPRPCTPQKSGSWHRAPILGLAHVSVSDPEFPQIAQDLEAKGLFRRSGDRTTLPPHIGAALANVHDEMAKRTI